MRRFLRLSLAFTLALTILPMIGAPIIEVTQAQFAGPGALVTQTGARGDAAGACSSTLSAGAATATVSLNAPGVGLSYYVDAVGVFGFVSAAAATAAIATVPTLTGFGGTSASIGWPIASSTGTTAASLGTVTGGWMSMATPVKANANTAVSLIGGSAITGAAQYVVICYHTSP